MIEEVFRIGSFSISPYGVMVVVALFLAYAHVRYALRHYGIGDEEDASAIVFACGLAGVVGGKVYYAAMYGDWRLVFDRAGIVFYGSFIAGVLVLLWVIRRRELPFARTFDATAPAVALGYGVGRVGCFLVGDDYGVPTDLPWGVTFRVGLPQTTAGNLRQEFGVEIPPEVADDAWMAVHPTQLYETAAGLAIWGLALYLMRRSLRPGSLALIVLGLLAVERFLIEFIRTKDDRYFGDFTLAQLIAVLILLTVAAVAWRRGRAEAARSAA